MKKKATHPSFVPTRKLFRLQCEVQEAFLTMSESDRRKIGKLKPTDLTWREAKAILARHAPTLRATGIKARPAQRSREGRPRGRARRARAPARQEDEPDPPQLVAGGSFILDDPGLDVVPLARFLAELEEAGL